MQDRAHVTRDYEEARRNGTLDTRDPVTIAGGEGKYVDMEIANSHDTDINRSGSLKGTLKKRIGSLRGKKDD